MRDRENITIRTGTREDLPQVLGLIKELAEYERAPQEVDNTVERMEQDGFGPEKVFDFLVAEKEGRIVGLALYYWSYSTWKGKCMYLEDLVVTESQRRFGVGRLLFRELIKIAREKDVRRLSWQVLEWNEPAIQFYKGIGAQLDPEWINGRLTYEQLKHIE
ncbi:N-acetyltransferase GCN5 [Flammeovirgaceae bacterium 311]|nr:N-acetyltransferase GCN5 [Flammeovirgaceae bacterium 311]